MYAAVKDENPMADETKCSMERQLTSQLALYSGRYVPRLIQKLTGSVCLEVPLHAWYDKENMVSIGNEA